MIDIVGTGIAFFYQYNQAILNNIDFEILAGKITAIIGRNGSGKSTLAKLIMGFLPLSEGNIYYNGINIKDVQGISFIRRHCGMIFQNPDNQFVSPVLEEDIRFGLDNHNVPEFEQNIRIHDALVKVKLSGYEKRSLSTLSGGQKQRAAAAGILAVKNDVFIFDEATSMLDPEGRKELLNCIKDFRDKNHTIILITQNTEDIVDADEIFVLDNHQIAAFGKPREILSNIDLLIHADIQVPFPVRVYHDLQTNGISLPYCPLCNEELAEVVCSLS